MMNIDNLMQNALENFYNEVILKFHDYWDYGTLAAHPSFGSPNLTTKFSYYLPVQIPSSKHWFLLNVKYPSNELENGYVTVLNKPMPGPNYSLQSNVTMWYAKCFGSLWHSRSNTDSKENIARRHKYQKDMPDDTFDKSDMIGDSSDYCTSLDHDCYGSHKKVVNLIRKMPTIHATY